MSDQPPSVGSVWRSASGRLYVVQGSRIAHAAGWYVWVDGRSSPLAKKDWAKMRMTAEAAQEGKAVSDVQTLAVEYLKLAEHIGGCGDGGCVVFIRKGMHTNGGCRCVRSINADKSREWHIHHLLSKAQQLARAAAKEGK